MKVGIEGAISVVSLVLSLLFSIHGGVSESKRGMKDQRRE